VLIQELNEWVNLAEGFASQVQQFDLICFFCAKPFEGEVVNSKCELNSGDHNQQTDNLTQLEKFQKDLEDNEQMYISSSKMNMRFGSGQKKPHKKVPLQGFTVETPPNVFVNNSR
jgi:hypothetical protein